MGGGARIGYLTLSVRAVLLQGGAGQGCKDRKSRANGGWRGLEMDDIKLSDH